MFKHLTGIPFPIISNGLTLLYVFYIRVCRYFLSLNCAGRVQGETGTPSALMPVESQQV